MACTKYPCGLDTGHDGEHADLAFHITTDPCPPDYICMRIKLVRERCCNLFSILQCQVSSAGNVDQAACCTTIINVKHRVAQAFPDNAFCLVLLFALAYKHDRDPAF